MDSSRGPQLNGPVSVKKIIFRLTFIVAAVLTFFPACKHVGQESSDGWISLFDGKSLNGWRASEEPGTFRVQNGAILVNGPLSHLYYVGPVQQHDFKNFELSLEVMTFPNSNSGVYFHTVWQETGFPQKGYEIQVNNSHKDPSRTGGLWGIQNNLETVAVDGKWFTLSIKVEGKRVVTKVDEKIITDYTEEENPVRNARVAHRRLGSGTFALQGHDPGSETHFRNIRVRILP
jgi:hypothetical protein